MLTRPRPPQPPDADVRPFMICEDGRVEVVCSHGIGHYSRRLTEQYSGALFEVHYGRAVGAHWCDGCCLQQEPWEIREARALDTLKRDMVATRKAQPS